MRFKSQRRGLNVNKRFLVWNTSRPRRAGQHHLLSWKIPQNSVTAASKQFRRMSTSNLLLMSSCFQGTTGVQFWVPIFMWALRSNQLKLLLSKVRGINPDMWHRVLRSNRSMGIARVELAGAFLSMKWFSVPVSNHMSVGRALEKTWGCH